MNNQPVPRTARQLEVLGYIRWFIKEHGYQPSYAQIAIYLGVSSKATVAKHIAVLERRGLLSRIKSAESRWGFALVICGDSDFEPARIKAKPHLSRPRPQLPEALRWEIWERDNFTCLKCNSRRHLNIDHIIPWELGGTHDKDNLQTLCRTCNTLKGYTIEDHRHAA